MIHQQAGPKSITPILMELRKPSTYSRYPFEPPNSGSAFHLPPPYTTSNKNNNNIPLETPCLNAAQINGIFVSIP